MTSTADLGSLVLLPQPRVLIPTSGGAPASSEPVTQHDPSLPPEGYVLDIGDSGIQLRHADPAGARYGTEALRQLRLQFGGRIPGLHIEDSPDLAVRGYMLDISRGRVPTMGYLRRLVDLLSLVRINQLQLYTEHTFAYAAHEPVWRDASPMTPEQVRQLDGWCQDLGIELVANQNSFGHMEHWLAHEPYRGRLAECPDGYEWGGARREPTTLEPTEAAADFALSLFRELLPNFRSRTVNIGCDETQEVGRGRSAARVAQVGSTEVYVEHLIRLATPLVHDGFQVQFWGDILYKHPKVLPRLPDGVIPVPWTYEAARSVDDLPDSVRARLAAVGVDAADFVAGFAPQIPTFAEAPFPFIVAPGTSTWNSLIGRIDNAYGNLDDAADSARNNGADGVLITEWGDGGHLQPPSVGWLPIAYGAAQAWCRATNRDLDMATAADLHLFADGEHRLGTVLERAGRLWNRTGRLAFNSSPINTALLFPAGRDQSPIDVEPTEAALDTLEQALSDVAAAQPDAVDGADITVELTAALRLARHGVWRLLREAGANCPSDAELRVDLGDALDAHLAAWDRRSRPGGREIGEGRLRRTLAEYEA